MKNATTSLWAIACCALFACTPKHEVPEDMFLIKGSLVNVADSSVIRLMTSDGSIGHVIAVDTVLNGQFEFCDSIPTNGNFLTLYSPSDGFSDVLLTLWTQSQTYIEIKGDGGLFVDWEVESTDPRQKEETDYVKAGFPEALEHAQVSVIENRYMQKVREQMRKTGKYSLGEYKEAIDSLNNITTPLYNQIISKQLDYLRKSPVTEHWLYKYWRFAKNLQYYKNNGKSDRASSIEELYYRIPQEALESEKGETITSYIYPPEIVNEGDNMVDGQLFDRDNRPQTLAQFKDKYILIDFWSSGCGPCIAAIPEMERMAEKYNNVAIVSISIDNPTIWREALETHKLKGIQWNELSAKNRLYNSYGNSKGIPYYVIISPDGKVLKKWSGYGKGVIEMALTSAVGK